MTRLGGVDLHLLGEGTHARLDRLGAHPGRDHTRFAVWAPNAESEAVIAECNDWGRGTAPLFNYRVGVPRGGLWHEQVNTHAGTFGGSGHGNLGGATAAPVPSHGFPVSLSLTLPPLGALYLKPTA